MDISATLESMINNFYKANPFTTKLGVKLVSLKEGLATIELPIVYDHTNVYGIAHGGVIMSLADMAMGAACLSTGKKVVTLDLTTNFIKALPDGKKALVTGKILHGGRSTLVADAAIYNENKELCATARGTFFVIGKMESEI